MGTAAEMGDFQVCLPCEPASVPEAKVRVREWCKSIGALRAVMSDVQLAITEAASNAVRHSGGADFEVLGQVTESSLIVSVWNRGQVDVHPGAGVGLEIMHGLAESVDFENTRPGARVTMRFPRASAPIR